MNLFSKQKQTHRLSEFMVTRGVRVGGVTDWKFEIDM